VAGNLEGLDRPEDGTRLESPGSIELLGEPRAEALEQLVRLARQRFGSKCVALRGRQDVQGRLSKMAVDRGLEIAEERER
jgi:hypothetical protein